MEFHENPSSGYRVFPRGRTDIRANMTMLTVTFSNFVNAHKYELSSCTATAPRNKKYPGRELLVITDGDSVHFDKSVYELPSFSQLTKSLRHSYIVDK
jgi:hypothetical protein